MVRRGMMLVALLLCAVAVPHAQFGVIGRSVGRGVPGASYYFASSGSDSNPCSVSLPCQTIGKANSLTLHPDDSVSFNGGDTFNDATLTITTSGTSGHPITFGSYGTGHALFGCGNVQCVTITDASYVTLQQLTMTGPGVVAATGLMVGGATNHLCAVEASSSQTSSYLQSLTLSSLTISGVWCGIYVHGTAATTPKGWDGLALGGTPSDPLIVHDAIWMGIWVYGSTSTSATTSGSPYYLAADRIHKHVHLYDFEVYNIYGRFKSQYACPSGCGSVGGLGAAGYDYNFTGSGVVLSNGTGTADGDNVVELGWVHDTGQNNDDTRGGPGNIWQFEHDYLTTRYVESRNAKSGSADGPGFDCDGGCTHAIYRANYSHDNKAYAFMTGTFTGNTTAPHDELFEFNISEKDATGCFAMFNGFATFVTFERNTCYETGLVSSTSLAVISIPNAGTTLNCIIRNNNLVVNDAGHLINFTVYGVPDTGVCGVYGNNYWSTAGSGSLRWSTSNGSGAGTFTSLAAFRASATNVQPEVYMASNVGTAVDPLLVSIGTGGAINSVSAMNSTLTAYDPTMSSTLPSGGVSGGTTNTDFHGNASMATGQGAVQ